MWSPKFSSFQYRLRFLLVLVALLAMGFTFLRYGLAYWKVVQARAAYEAELVRYEANLAPPMSIPLASEALCQAEQTIPFADRVRAQALHVVRLTRYERKARLMFEESMYATQQEHDAGVRKFNQIPTMRLEAEERLDALLSE